MFASRSGILFAFDAPLPLWRIRGLLGRAETPASLGLRQGVKERIRHLFTSGAAMRSLFVRQTASRRDSEPGHRLLRRVFPSTTPGILPYSFASKRQENPLHYFFATVGLREIAPFRPPARGFLLNFAR